MEPDANQTCQRCGAEIPATASEKVCPRCALADALNSSAGDHDTQFLALHDIPQAGQKVSYIGDYELLDIIAHGGMGVVYRARQKSLNRIVALKLLLGGPHASDDFKRRFRQEAEMAAKLQHPNIVPIYEVGEYQGQPYFSMEYVAGTNLADLTREKPLPPRKAAEYMKTVAEAIAYAHLHSVLHRDLKPSNILLGTDDRPRVTDFGLARQMDAESSLTMSGEMLGTPGYLPPEQVSVKGGTVGPHSDVYSLGAVLFHLLSGRSPFMANAMVDMLQQVLESDPVALNQLNPAIPRDLETICLKCLRKNSQDRYGEMRLLVEDLNRYLEGEPILARPVGKFERMWKWGQRHPLIAGLSAAMISVLLLGALIVTWQWRRVDQESSRAEIAEKASKAVAKAADTERDRAAASAYLTEFKAAEQFMTDDRPYRAVAAFASMVRHSPTNRLGIDRLISALTFRPALRLFSRASIQAGQIQGTGPFDLPNGTRVSVVSAPDGQKVIEVDENGSVRIRDLVSNKTVRINISDGASVLESGFGVNSEWGWLSFRRSGLRVFNSISGKVFDLGPDIKGLPHYISPDGFFLLTTDFSGDDYNVAAYDAANGDFFWRLHGKQLHNVSFSPDSKFVVMAGIEDSQGEGINNCQIRDSATGRPVGTALKHDAPVLFAVFSPDGSRVATISADKTARIWDAASGCLFLPPLRYNEDVNALCFSPNGNKLMAWSDNGTALIWNVKTGEPRAIRLRHEAKVNSAAFSPDGMKVVSASDDATMRIWDATTGEPLCDPVKHSGPVTRSRFTRDGRWVQTVSKEDGVLLWDARPASAYPCSLDTMGLEIKSQLANVPPMTAHRYSFAKTSPDGKKTLVLTADQKVVVLDSRTGQTLMAPLEHVQNIDCGVFSHNSRRVFIGCQLEQSGKSHNYLFSSAQVFDVSSGDAWNVLQDQMVVGEPFRVNAAAFSQDSSHITVNGASDSGQPGIRIWDLRTNTPSYKQLGHVFAPSSVDYSPDGSRIVTTPLDSHDKFAQLWDMISGEPIGIPMNGESPTSAVFSPSGLLVVSVGSTSVSIWDAFTGQRAAEPLLTPEIVDQVYPDGSRSLAEVERASFSPDGSRLLTVLSGGYARVLDIRSGQPLTDTLTFPSVAFTTNNLKLLDVSASNKWITKQALTSGGSVILGDLEFLSLPFYRDPAPEWLPDLAEACAGEKFNSYGILEQVPRQSIKEISDRFLSHIGNDDYGKWVKWFLSNQDNRPLAPCCLETLEQYVDKQVKLNTEQSLRLAEHLPSTNGLLYSRFARTLIYENDASHGLIRREEVSEAVKAQADDLSLYATLLAPSCLEVWEARFDVLKEVTNAPESVRSLEHALVLGSSRPSLWLVQADRLLQTNRIEEALAAANRALTLGSATNAQEVGLVQAALRSRAQIFAQIGRRADALAEEERFNPDLWLARANEFQSGSHFDEAIEAYAKAINLAVKFDDRPRELEAHRQRGELLRKLNRVREAEFDDQQAFVLEAKTNAIDTAESFNDAAWDLVMGMDVIMHTDPTIDTGRAIAYARHAIEMDKEKASYFDTLGVAYYRAKRYQEAATNLKKAVELSDGNPHYPFEMDFLFLAMASENLHDSAGATNWLAKARWERHHHTYFNFHAKCFFDFSGISGNNRLPCIWPADSRDLDAARDEAYKMFSNDAID